VSARRSNWLLAFVIFIFIPVAEEINSRGQTDFHNLSFTENAMKANMFQCIDMLFIRALNIVSYGWRLDIATKRKIQNIVLDYIFTET
jgi:hypothetical protein